MTTTHKAATHTPGPWSISGQLINGAPEPRANPKVEPYPHTVAAVCWDYDGDRAATGDLPWAVAAANARLIAAAPALLEALEGLLANSPPPKRIKDDFSYLLYREAAARAITAATRGGAL